MSSNSSTAGNNTRLKVIFDFEAEAQDELAATKGMVLVGFNRVGDWWHAKNPQTNQIGIIPANYVQEDVDF